MSLLCPTGCGSIPVVPDSYFSCIDNFYEYGSAKIVAQKCDATWTDLLSTSEWTTKMGSDTVHILPPGKVTVSEPTQTTFEVDGEGRKAVGEVTYVVDYETYQFGSSAPAACVYWQTIFENTQAYRINWITKGGHFAVDKEWATEIAAGAPATLSGKNPGFEFSLTKVPAVVEGEAGKAKWVCQFEIKYTGVIHYVALPGVIQVLA